jgi:segregation and condensation protein B
MQEGRNTIPIGEGTLGERMPDWKNRFPGAVAFVETLDMDLDTDDAEPADVLSFESLREAFATIQAAETELAQSIPEVDLSGGSQRESPERPEYNIDNTPELEDERHVLPSSAEPPVAVGVRLETIIEAMLFVGNRENQPLDAGQIAEKLRNVSEEEVHQAVCYLNEQYQRQNRPYTITADRGGYRMVLCSEFESVRSNFYGKARETRLSQQAIDTLAVVAYRQPITAEEIQNIRQQSCSTVLNQLVRRRLLKISREVQNKKSVVRYHTTPRFLELFHLHSLDDIPPADEWDCR